MMNNRAGFRLLWGRKSVLLGMLFPALVLFFLLPTNVFSAEPQTFMGKASWYGVSAHGKKTASGRVFHRADFSAAHRNLPFGTVLRVHNLANSYHVLVVVTDRGPFVKGRVLDVSHSAARALNFTRRGVTTIWSEVVSDKDGIPLDKDSEYYLQLGSRPDKASSSEFQRNIRFRLNLETVLFYVSGDHISPYRVCVGPWSSFTDAENFLDTIPEYYQNAQVILGPKTGTELPLRSLPDAIKAVQKRSVLQSDPRHSQRK